MSDESTNEKPAEAPAQREEAAPASVPTWGDVAASGETWADRGRRTWDGKPAEAPTEKED